MSIPDDFDPFDDGTPAVTAAEFDARCQAARAARLAGLEGEALADELALIEQESYDDAIIEDGPLAFWP